MYYFQNYHNIDNLNEADQFGQNALHIACSGAFYELTKYILSHGKINLYAQDCNGNTCLHMAAKAGMPKTSYAITRKNNGDCIRLVTIANNQNQTPYDLIRNETKPNFVLLKNWLRLEANTNEYLLENKHDYPFSKKRSPSLTSYFKWNTDNDRRFQWMFQFMKFPIIMTVPMLINMILFDKNDFSLLQGLIGYSTFIFIVATVAKLAHRIPHISGAQNPYLFGLIFSILFYNYTTYFLFFLESI